MHKRFALILWVVLLVPTVFVLAQQAQPPNAITFALTDLSARLGRTIAFSDLQNWSWEQSIYPDASMGCPKAGMAYAQVQTSAFKFILTYNGTQYDYRVASANGAVVLCNSDSVPPPAQTTVCPPPGDAGYIQPRLRVGSQGRVAMDNNAIPNNVRSIPGTSGTYLGEIPPGGVFTILSGPQCSQVDKLVWWQVTYNTITGWTVEGKVENGRSDYWLEPLDLAQIPTPVGSTTATAISPTNASQVALLTNFVTPLGVTALAPDGKLLATGGVDGIVSLLDTTTGAARTTFQAHNTPITSLAFSPDGKVLVTGGSDGQIKLWDIASAGATQKSQLQGHTASVDALTFSPVNGLLASGSADGRVILWDASLGMAVGQLTGHSGTITRLVFSVDGSNLVVSDSGGTTRLWGLRPAGSG